MKILHICNWCSGITTRNVNALKQYSRHSHELVTRILHPYDLGYEPAMFTEATTTMGQVMELADEADALHFHAVGYNGSAGHPETIHGIDWSQYRRRKRFIFTGMISMWNGVAWVGSKDFMVEHLGHYDTLMGPHLSCKFTYDKRLEYVPDIIPISDWIYTPHTFFPKPWQGYSFKESAFRILQLKTPTRFIEQMMLRRHKSKVNLDNSTDGHWGLFAMESLSQGVPCAAYTHPVDKECWQILGVPEPPLIEVNHGGANTNHMIQPVMEADDATWLVYSLKCRQWIEDFYNPKNLVKRWDAIYG